MSSMVKLYDLSAVEALCGGDQEFIKTMAKMFVDTMPQSIGEIKDAVASENWEMVGKHAHKMKSTIDSMGINSIKEDIRTVETNGKAKTNPDLIRSVVEKVVAVLNDCVAQIKNDYAL